MVFISMALTDWIGSMDKVLSFFKCNAIGLSCALIIGEESNNPIILFRYFFFLGATCARLVK